MDARASLDSISKDGCSYFSKTLQGMNSRHQCIELTCSRRFQRHRGFVILCYDILRRRHSLSKTNFIAGKDTWETTGDLRHYYGTIEYQGRGTPHIHMTV